MKKGIECYPDYDRAGRWCLVIKKKRGKLSLEEINAAAREWESDYYLLPLDCFHDEEEQFADVNDDNNGDQVVLYRTDLFYKEGEH